MSKFNLIVAEGHWSNYSNHTVKSLFDLLSDLLKSSQHSYKYTQFADPAAFNSCISQLRNSTHKYLYIGSHGSIGGIHGATAANPLTYTLIKNRISGLDGLYLGTCLFGQPANLLKFVKESDLTWCAGYKNSVDWVDSSALDLAFWKVFQMLNTQKGKKVELSLIESTMKTLRTRYSSLILELGFNVAIRRLDKDGDELVELVF